MTDPADITKLDLSMVDALDALLQLDEFNQLERAMAPVGIHDDETAATSYEIAFSAATRALWSIPAGEHEAIARAWEAVAEAASDAAHQEWKRARRKDDAAERADGGET